MATLNWLARAVARVQIMTFTINGTAAANDVYTLTINGKSASFTATGAGNPAVATGLQAAAAAMTALEFTRITWTVNSNVVTATGTQLGVNHVVTATETAAAGSIATSTTQTASGPNDWDNVNNWDTGALPANGDTVNIDLTRGSILTGLDQSAVTLAQLRVFSSTGTSNVIGLAELNSDGYTEYRGKFLRIGATLAEIDCDSPRLNIDLVAAASTLTVLRCGASGVGNVPAMRLRGSSASNTIKHYSGYLGLAFFDDETFVCSTIETLGATAKLSTGQGLTCTTIAINGSQAKINRGTITAIYAEGGNVDILSFTGTTLSITKNASATLGGDNGTPAITVDRARLTVLSEVEPSSTTLGPGGSISDPYGQIVWTGGIAPSAGTLSLSV